MTPTSKVVLDAWAWLELFSGSEKGRAVDRRVSEAAQAYTSSVTLAEVVSVSARRGRTTEDKIASIRSLPRIDLPSSDDAMQAGLLHAEVTKRITSFSLADAFVLQLARKVGAKVLTGDPDFRGVKEAELIG